MARPDRPIEPGDDLAPITVGPGETDDRGDIDAGGDDVEQDVAGDESAAPQPREESRQAPQQRQAPTGQQGQPGQPKRDKPSSWKATIAREVGKATTAQQQTIQKLEQTIAALQGRYEAMEKFAPARQQQEDPVSQRVSGIEQRMTSLATMAAGELSAEQRKAVNDEYAQLSREYLKLQIDEGVKAGLAAHQKANPPQQSDPQVAAAVNIVATEFPRLGQDPSARQAAKAYYGYLVAENGGQDSLNLFREACQYVYTKRGWPSEGYRPDTRGRQLHETTTGRRGNGGAGPITFDTEALKIMRGAPVSPEQVAEEMRRMQGGG